MASCLPVVILHTPIKGNTITSIPHLYYLGTTNAPGRNFFAAGELPVFMPSKQSGKSGRARYGLPSCNYSHFMLYIALKKVLIRAAIAYGALLAKERHVELLWFTRLVIGRDLSKAVRIIQDKRRG